LTPTHLPQRALRHSHRGKAGLHAELAHTPMHTVEELPGYETRPTHPPQPGVFGKSGSPRWNGRNLQLDHTSSFAPPLEQ